MLITFSEMLITFPIVNNFTTYITCYQIISYLCKGSCHTLIYNN